MNRKFVVSFIAIYCLAAGLGFFLSGNKHSEYPLAASYILQGKSTEAVVEAVASVEGQITHEFMVINAVVATLTTQQRDALLVNPAIIAIGEDSPLNTTAGITARPAAAANINSAVPSIAALNRATSDFWQVAESED